MCAREREIEIERRTYILVSEQTMEVDDGCSFFPAEISSLEIRPEVVVPSKPTAFAASQQTCRRNQNKYIHTKIIMRWDERDIYTCSSRNMLPVAYTMLSDMLMRISSSSFVHAPLLRCSISNSISIFCVLLCLCVCKQSEWVCEEGEEGRGGL